MTYNEWENALVIAGGDIKTAMDDLGITPQALFKWRKADRVSKMALFYLKSLEDKTIELKVDTNNIDSYDNLVSILFVFKSAINILYAPKDNKDINKIDTAIELSKNSMALIAVKSIKLMPYDNHKVFAIDFLKQYQIIDEYLTKFASKYSIDFNNPYVFKNIIDLKNAITDTTYNEVRLIDLR